MTIQYSLLGIDEDGNVFVDLTITPDEVIKFLASARSSEKAEPAAPAEPVTVLVPAPKASKKKPVKKAKASTPGKVRMRDRVLGLHKIDVSIEDIARQTGLGVDGVKYHLRAAGIAIPRKTRQKSYDGEVAMASRAPEHASVEQDDEAASEGKGSARVKEMIRNGLDDEFIANEVGTKIRTVAFIRRQMRARGEIN